ncbi:MAG TPA: site-2 protease family protein [Pirellulales bacterium]|nr:site-2 protease family protein [Pirellulales bacterium]
MGLHLIGALGIQDWVTAAIGLGLVIFVHELGHFLVAKACGVKCEKFYLGFDINGWRIFRFRWGETEYGIGILPLGGYVKMLGQDDNPTRAAEERERAKMQQSHTAAVKHPGDLPAEPTSDEHIAYDPRSYMAKSVPQRMAIISAGVIMNVIFAVIFAAIAYRNGVRYIPCVIGGTAPGKPAWTAGIQPGDKIIRFDNERESETLRYDHDLQMSVVLTGANNPLDLEVRRYGTEQTETFVLRPIELRQGDKSYPGIGVIASLSTKFASEPTIPDTSAAKATPEFKAGDTIKFIRRTSDRGKEGESNQFVKQPVGDYQRMQEILATFADHPLDIYVERTDGASPGTSATEVKINVLTNPMRVLGLVMGMGPIAAIQKNSPAEAAGFKVGDRIVSVNGQRNIDPLRLGEPLRSLVGQEVAIEVERTENGKETSTVSLKVKPRAPRNFMPPSENGPGSSDELGIAYSVSNTVQSVELGSPADGKLEPGDELTSVSFSAPTEDEKRTNKLLAMPEKPIEFGADHHNWLLLHHALQVAPIGQKVELSWSRGAEKKSAILETAASKDWLNPERGFRVETLSAFRHADSWGEALALGLRETKESVWQIATTVRKLATGQIPLTDLGGPGTIAAAAAVSASEGISRFLIFLTFLSANLAVLNFLPIPILDGGHMVFLLYEGIRGKPASERTMMALTYLGLIFILVLMVFVLGLDIHRLWPW